jgi:hypothetical protein
MRRRMYRAMKKAGRPVTDLKPEFHAEFHAA